MWSSHGKLGALRRQAGSFRREVLFIVPECLGLLVCIALIWISELAPLHQERVTAEQSARDNTSNLARAFEENTERVVAGIDQILLTARAAYADHRDSFDVVDWANKRVKVDKFAFFLGRVDASGQTRESTLKPAPRSIDISDREHFRAQLDPSRDELFISTPVIGRATRRPALQFTRKLQAADGGFDGILQVSLDAGELSRFYESLDIGAGFIALVGTDGIVRARGPLDFDKLGKPAGGPDLLAAISAGNDGVLALPTGKGEVDIVSFRKVNDYPLRVLVGFDHNDIFAKYRSSRRHALIWSVVLTVLALVVGVFWIRQRRRGVRDRLALHLTLESIDQGIVMLDAAGRMPVLNERARRLLQLTCKQGDRPGPELLKLPAADGGHAGPAVIEHVCRNGNIIEIQQHRTAVDGTVLTYTDVTERRLQEAHIRHLAHHDPLTGLANRLVLNDCLVQRTSLPDPSGHPFAVLCLDLDGFKNVNDSLGHDMGDALLCIVARRILREVRSTDLVARTGGDEFTVLLGAGNDLPAEAEELARRIIDALNEPITAENCTMTVQVSVGVSYFPKHGTDARSLLRNADLALYRAKAGGRGLCRVFDATMDESYRNRRQLEEDLRAALATDQIELFMQPQFDGMTLEVSGLETLVRWRHPVRGLVPPATFIPIAEECGLIAQLGCKVLAEACRLAASWKFNFRIAVNVSPIQLRDAAFPVFVAQTLSASGLSPALLEMEVTEGVLMGDDPETLEGLRAIKELGVTIALDDFGTGYSSLSYLQRFQFDRIKVDRSFVQAQGDDLGTQAIIDAVLAMTTRLGLNVTAEGVETEEQLNLLRAQGCTELQGYLLGRPMPAADVPAFVAATRAEFEVSMIAE